MASSATLTSLAGCRHSGRESSEIVRDVWVTRHHAKVGKRSDLAAVEENKLVANLPQDIKLEGRRRVQADENEATLAPQPTKKSSMKPIKPSCVLNCGSSNRWTSG